ncbi:MAG: hotdog fold thioesterase, partial [Chitinophagaceae bacterium]
MTNNEKARQVVNKMMKDDLFSKWLGIEILDVKEGYSKIKMSVRKEMINGFGIVHGGIAFSLADSAFAFACNNRNNLSVALDTAINFTKPVHVGDELTAEAIEIHNGKSTGLYHISISNQKAHVV